MCIAAAFGRRCRPRPRPRPDSNVRPDNCNSHLHLFYGRENLFYGREKGLKIGLPCSYYRRVNKIDVSCVL